MDGQFSPGQNVQMIDRGTQAPPAASNASAFTLALLNSANGGQTTSASHTSRGLGTAAADRRIYALISTLSSGGTNTLSSVVIAGQAATIHRQRTTGNIAAAIASAVVTTGTSGDVTWTNSVSSYSRLTLYRATGITTAASNATDDVTNILNMTLNVPAAGGVLAVASNRNRGASTWSGITEEFDDDMFSSDHSSGGSIIDLAADATYAISCDAPTSGNEAVGVAISIL